jgi:Resolvase, N terminal domain
MAVDGYCRVSTLKQASEGESLDVQRRQIEGYALMHAVTLADVLVEEGVSGSIPVEERPVDILEELDKEARLRASNTLAMTMPSKRDALASRRLGRGLLDAQELRLVGVGQRGGDQAILAHDEINERRRFRTGGCEAGIACHIAGRKSP